MSKERRQRNFPQDLPEESFLAFDVNVSNTDIGMYAREGHIISCVCREAEADEDFLERAFTMGVEFVFSQDADIGNIIEQKNYPMKWIRHVG